MRDIPDPPAGYTPVDPREWTRVWLRVIAPPSVKLTGYALTAFADYKSGANVRPGTLLLCKVTGLKERSVRDSLSQIREWGLIWRYAEGSKSGKEKSYDAYRLTFPHEIDGIPMMDPDWHLMLWKTLWITQFGPGLDHGQPPALTAGGPVDHRHSLPVVPRPHLL